MVFCSGEDESTKVQIWGSPSYKQRVCSECSSPESDLKLVHKVVVNGFVIICWKIRIDIKCIGIVDVDGMVDCPDIWSFHVLNSSALFVMVFAVPCWLEKP